MPSLLVNGETPPWAAAWLSGQAEVDPPFFLLLPSLRAECGRQGLSVDSLAIDGMPLTDSLEIALGPLPFSSMEALAVTATDLSALGARGLTEMMELSGYLSALCRRAIPEVRRGTFDGLFLQVLEMLELYVDAARSLPATGIGAVLTPADQTQLVSTLGSLLRFREHGLYGDAAEVLDSFLPALLSQVAGRYPEAAPAPAAEGMSPAAPPPSPSA